MPQFLKIAIATLLFAAQVFLSLDGVSYFGKYWNPVWLLLTHLALFALYLSSIQANNQQKTAPASTRIRLLGAALGALSILLCAPSIQALFHSISNPVEYSDVIPQLHMQYERFKAGILPYQYMDLPHSKPYPVYMPLHWLPAGIPDLLGIDIRWSGIYLLTIAAALFGWHLFRQQEQLPLKMFGLALPAVVLICFCYRAGSELAVSLETVITAYYLVLAAGLFARNWPLTLLGLVCCFLSRYTLIFWVPLFVLLLFRQQGLKPVVTLIATLVAAVLLLYVIPFLSQDPTIFLTGLRYHNDAAAFEWGHGAWTFENGLYFAPHINEIVAGSWEHKVFVARILQAVSMLLLLGYGLLYPIRKSSVQSFYDFSLAMLYLFMVVFYMVGPLTYRYYLLTPLTLSAILVAKMIVVTNIKKSVG